MGQLWESFPPAPWLTGLVAQDREQGFLVINILLVAFGLWCLVWPFRRGWPSAITLGWVWVTVEVLNGIVHPSWRLCRGDTR